MQCKSLYSTFVRKEPTGGATLNFKKGIDKNANKKLYRRARYGMLANPMLPSKVVQLQSHLNPHLWTFFVCLLIL
jgi:hypothetical protein